MNSLPLELMLARTLFALVVVLTCSDPGGAADVDPELALRIGRALENSFAEQSLADPPTRDRIAEFDSLAADKVGPAWGVRKRTRRDDNQGNVDLYYEIALMPEDYQPDPASEARWRELVVGNHETGAEVAFIERSVGGVRRHQVYYRLVRNNVRLIHQATREGNETAKEAIGMSGRRFKQFYDYARDQKLIAPAESRSAALVVTTDRDPDGVVENGEVIEVPFSGGGPVATQFTVLVNAPDLDPDQPFALEVQLEPVRGGAQARFVDAAGRPLADADKDQWCEWPVKSGKDPGVLRLNLGPFAERGTDGKGYALDEFVIGRIRVRPRQGGEAVVVEFGVQRRTWHAIVQRFEVFPRDWNPGREEDQLPPGQMLDGRFGFNEYLQRSGTLVENYEKLRLDFAQKRDQIAPGEPVCLGWHLDPTSEDADDFYVLQDSSKKRALASLPIRRPLSFMYDLKVLYSPKVDAVPGKTASANGAGSDGFDLPDVADSLDVERELRRQLQVDAFRITLNVIEETPIGESLADFQQAIPERLRKAPVRGRNPIVVMEAETGKRRVDDCFPLDQRFLDPDGSLFNRTPQFRSKTNPELGPFRAPGIYELRLETTLKHEDGSSREIDVALRFAVDPTAEFSVTHRLAWEQQRAANRPAK
jgi:hypothetical protein